MAVSREVFLLAGPNGSGKTDLLASIRKRHAVYEPEWIRSNASFVEFLRTVPGSLSKVILLDQRPYWLLPSRLVETILTIPLLMRGVSLASTQDVVDRTLNEFDFGYLGNRDYESLSGGERYIVDILARALLLPDALLLDGCLSMLDQSRQARLMKFLTAGSAAITPMSVVLTTAEYERLAEVDRTKVNVMCPAVRTLVTESHKIVRSAVARMKASEGRAPNGVSASISIDCFTATIGGVTLLEDVVFEFKPGVHILSAENGSGKTVLLRSIRFPGSKAGQIITPKNLGYLPQDPTSILGFDSIGEEICKFGVPSDWTCTTLRELQDVRLVPDRIPARGSSAGERQFFAVLIFFSVALARGWSAVLMDEPDAGLDENHALACFEMIAALAQELNVIAIVTSHRPAIYHRFSESSGVQVNFLTIENKKLAHLSRKNDAS